MVRTQANDTEASCSSCRCSIPAACCERRLASSNELRPGHAVEAQHVSIAGLIVEPEEAAFGVAAVVQIVERDGVEEAVALHGVGRGGVAEPAAFAGDLRDLRIGVEARRVQRHAAGRSAWPLPSPERVVTFATAETLLPYSAGTLPVNSSTVCTMLGSRALPKAPVS